MPRLHTTTVRFDADAWEQVGVHADRLGLARSAFIRDATQARIARCEVHDEIRQLHDRIDRLEQFVTRAIRARRSP